MVNPNTQDTNMRIEEDLETLKKERKKTVTHCLNLECQNEQLKILIEKLHKLANQRENLFAKTQNPKVFSEELDHLYLKSSSISDELQTAKENSKKIEKIISELKSKILKLDQIISK